jgi:hypothetical protein
MDGGSAGVWAATLQGMVAFAMRDDWTPSKRRRRQQHKDRGQQREHGIHSSLFSLRRNHMVVPASRLHSGQMSQVAGLGTRPLTQLALAADSDHARHMAFVCEHAWRGV